MIKDNWGIWFIIGIIIIGNVITLKRLDRLEQRTDESTIREEMLMRVKMNKPD